MTTTAENPTTAATSVNGVLELLSALVACDSTTPTGEERTSAQVLAGYLDAAGFAVDIDELGPGRVNLLARRRFAEHGPKLMVNSHLDVVPAGPGWTSEPFEPTVRDGKLYGRGAADAKGALAAMACAAAELVAAEGGAPLIGELVYTAVSDEEGGSTGARHLLSELAQADDLPDAVIIGEPTGMRPLTAHKGSIRPVIEVVGVAAHAATPKQGVNAVNAAGAVLAALDGYSQGLEAIRHPLLGSPTCTPVLIGGGEAPNAVPEPLPHHPRPTHAAR
ncbi:M20 family metallopeptidase [Saccharopolyspora phatthalungensis]|uniref:Acetylornithine deacetylase/succinyl-diaminopimelate desuccinylase-like protein n=1 Tax=Saccharopolyspora phatthalungensis TaxID=664693 RepID=A0A840QC41_9PSEU|nr:M20/M25/M40 family metallo-hydrolase [Saccharopolyspora phatthalungensis]MBB5158304.1 acetylornithine deacetylase/succinyl-diaminopimelate desuccinylase-like protein [Saccharopolyspora phatthalungensis]